VRSLSTMELHTGERMLVVHSIVPRIQVLNVYRLVTYKLDGGQSILSSLLSIRL
jgi:hypothetical protein